MPFGKKVTLLDGDTHVGTTFGAFTDVHTPTVGLAQLMDDREPKTAAACHDATRPVDSKKRLEHFFTVFRRNTWT